MAKNNTPNKSVIDKFKKIEKNNINDMTDNLLLAHNH